MAYNQKTQYQCLVTNCRENKLPASDYCALHQTPQERHHAEQSAYADAALNSFPSGAGHSHMPACSSMYLSHLDQKCLYCKKDFKYLRGYIRDEVCPDCWKRHLLKLLDEAKKILDDWTSGGYCDYLPAKLQQRFGTGQDFIILTNIMLGEVFKRTTDRYLRKFPDGGDSDSRVAMRDIALQALGEVRNEVLEGKHLEAMRISGGDGINPSIRTSVANYNMLGALAGVSRPPSPPFSLSSSSSSSSSSRMSGYYRTDQRNKLADPLNVVSGYINAGEIIEMAFNRSAEGIKYSIKQVDEKKPITEQKFRIESAAVIPQQAMLNRYFYDINWGKAADGTLRMNSRVPFDIAQINKFISYIANVIEPLINLGFSPRLIFWCSEQKMFARLVISQEDIARTNHRVVPVASPAQGVSAPRSPSTPASASSSSSSSPSTPSSFVYGSSSAASASAAAPKVINICFKCMKPRSEQDVAWEICSTCSAFYSTRELIPDVNAFLSRYLDDFKLYLRKIMIDRAIALREEYRSVLREISIDDFIRSRMQDQPRILISIMKGIINKELGELQQLKMACVQVTIPALPLKAIAHKSGPVCALFGCQAAKMKVTQYCYIHCIMISFWDYQILMTKPEENANPKNHEKLVGMQGWLAHHLCGEAPAPRPLPPPTSASSSSSLSNTEILLNRLKSYVDSWSHASGKQFFNHINDSLDSDRTVNAENRDLLRSFKTVLQGTMQTKLAAAGKQLDIKQLANDIIIDFKHKGLDGIIKQNQAMIDQGDRPVMSANPTHAMSSAAAAASPAAQPMLLQQLVNQTVFRWGPNRVDENRAGAIYDTMRQIISKQVNIQSLKTLLSKQKQIRPEDKLHAFYIAVQNNLVDCMRVLLGSDRNIKVNSPIVNNNNATVLHLALFYGQFKAAEFLLVEKQAAIENRMINNVTVFHLLIAGLMIKPKLPEPYELFKDVQAVVVLEALFAKSSRELYEARIKGVNITAKELANRYYRYDIVELLQKYEHKLPALKPPVAIHAARAAAPTAAMPVQARPATPPAAGPMTAASAAEAKAPAPSPSAEPADTSLAVINYLQGGRFVPPLAGPMAGLAPLAAAPMPAPAAAAAPPPLLVDVEGEGEGDESEEDDEKYNYEPDSPVARPEGVPKGALGPPGGPPVGPPGGPPVEGAGRGGRPPRPSAKKRNKNKQIEGAPKPPGRS